DTQTGIEKIYGAADNINEEPVINANGECIWKNKGNDTITLAAYWQAQVYTITYEKNKGIGHLADINVEYDKKITQTRIPCSIESRGYE
ncbi:MAG: hypothetical protein K5765_05255, partial [Clostridia bacterium]|nr:hypothetical protein [Clostridia bacterium]